MKTTKIFEYCGALPENVFLEVKLRKALEKNDAAMVAEVTVKIKASEMEGIWEQFQLENYPGLSNCLESIEKSANVPSIGTSSSNVKASSMVACETCMV